MTEHPQVKTCIVLVLKRLCQAIYRQQEVIQVCALGGRLNPGQLAPNHALGHDGGKGHLSSFSL
jgi:hypothetical protein